MSDPGVTAKTRNRSIAISDTFGLFDDSLLLTYGVRRQQLRVENYTYEGTMFAGTPYGNNDGSRSSLYDEAITTPVYGIVYKPTETISIYASRIEGLAQGPVACTVPFGLTTLPLPIPLPEIAINVFWHARCVRDPANRWFRQLMFDLFSD